MFLSCLPWLRAAQGLPCSCAGAGAEQGSAAATAPPRAPTRQRRRLCAGDLRQSHWDLKEQTTYNKGP